MCISFSFNDPPTTEIYTLSLHDALPICRSMSAKCRPVVGSSRMYSVRPVSRLDSSSASFTRCASPPDSVVALRSEEHTSELQSRQYLVCRLLLEKKKNTTTQSIPEISES